MINNPYIKCIKTINGATNTQQNYAIANTIFQ